MVQVLVRFNNIELALKTLKKKMQREGIFKTMKQRYFEKPSEVRVRKAQESARRRRKLDRKRHFEQA